MNDIVCYFLIENGVVIQKSYPFVEGWVEGPDWVAPGCLYADGVFSLPPPVVPTYEEYLLMATEELNRLNRQANAQVTAIQGRIDTINDAIEFGEETPEEVAKLPVRTAQLKAWKLYRIQLGRMTSTAGWPIDPQWPTVPTPYTNEMSAVTQPQAPAV